MNKIILAIALALGISSVNAEQPFKKGEVLVKFKDENKAAEVFNSVGRSKKQFKGTKIHILEVPEHAEKQVRDALAKNPNVELAELNELHAPTFVPNDPLRGNQWWLATVKAYEAMDLSTGQNVIVGVCDSSFNPHEDLQNLFLDGWDFWGEDGDLTSGQGHGTGVSAVIAANTNNGLGVAAPAHNVRIIPGKIGNDDNGYAYYSDMVQCAEHMADNGAKVINFSYGGVCGSSNVTAAKYANSKGATVHWSAGNSNALIACANVEEQTVVSATTSNNTKASFSSYGPAVDLTAPGSGVYSAYGNGYSYYSNLNGTSFSSPITAAAAALVFAKNPGATPAQVREVLYSTAVDLNNSDYYGHGLVDFAAAVNVEINTPPPPPPPEPVCGNGIVEEGEACDDGNLINGDGCDSSCQVEPPSPPPEPEPDIEAPVINLKSPVEGGSYSRQVAIQGIATDNVELDYIEIHVNTGLAKYIDVTDTNSKRFNHRAKLPKGNHTARVVAVDISGNAEIIVINFSINK